MSSTALHIVSIKHKSLLAVLLIGAVMRMCRLIKQDVQLKTKTEKQKEKKRWQN